MGLKRLDGVWDVVDCIRDSVNWSVICALVRLYLHLQKNIFGVAILLKIPNIDDALMCVGMELTFPFMARAQFVDVSDLPACDSRCDEFGNQKSEAPL